jgi:uncharacterized RDD family membrane protein YckC
MQTVKIHTSQNISIDYPVAGLGERILGRLIDLGIFLVLYFLVIFVSVYGSRNGLVWGYSILIWIYVIVICFYDLVCEIFFNGQSVGKMVMKIKVVSLDGARPSLGQYLLRWVFRMVDFSVTLNLAALISVASTVNKQRIGDLVAGTTLIKTQAQTQLRNLAFVPQNENYLPVYPEVIHLSDKDILLIHEVIDTYSTSGNSNLLYNMKIQIQNHLGIKTQTYVDDLEFLETIVKDYNHLAVRTETI